MPIRFRCAHCNQLMGIARRKAGALVRCPSCHQEMAVPAHATEDPPPTVPEPAPAPAPARPKPDLFDRDDFDSLLRGTARTEGTQSSASIARAPENNPAPPAPAPACAIGPGPRALQPIAPTGPARDGLVLTPTWLTVLTVVFILLLAASFALGLLVGRYALN